MNIEGTICAISSPHGTGAISVIRMTGESCIEIFDRYFFPSRSKKKFSELKPFTIHLGLIIAGNRIIDEVLASFFKSPDSYTGEDMVEISCHGSTFIQSEILKLMVESGARIANPGEFTQRAFLNEKIDLSQAEAIADLIASNSKASHTIAINQMKGGFHPRSKN